MIILVRLLLAVEKVFRSPLPREEGGGAQVMGSI